MSNEFNDEFVKEIPDHVRQRLDQTYEQIRFQSIKKKKHIIWTRMATAACCLLIVGVASTSEPVKAAIFGIFKFNDSGIEQAVKAGFAEETDQSATNENVRITLDSYFSDNNKMGFSFQLQFKDLTLLGEEAERLSLDVRLKNGDGEYIVELIPDTKPLYGKSEYSAGVHVMNPFIEQETGKAQFDTVFESTEGNFPALSNAIIEVESINVQYANGEFKKIEGEWNLPLKEAAKPFEVVEYVAQESDKIKLVKANGNPTSLSLTISIDGEPTETPFAIMKVVDEQGIEYEAGSTNMTVKSEQTIISTTFPISSFVHAEKLQLIVGNEQVELTKKND
ncbi:DUF4179 domain-containing protein [Paenisporosarcina sp. FSL H8-0542]|uniref:DUF4179 domain-containing protein n=1 Tax=Paenisporosarcina sp. FSL H8-0542 TaxID=2921401 RepID=UPI003159A91C